MTVFNPNTHQSLFSIGTASAERLWHADMMAAIIAQIGMHSIVIQIATPAAPDQDKIWFQPVAGSTAPGTFYIYNDRTSTWDAMTGANYAGYILGQGSDSYDPANGGATNGNVGETLKIEVPPNGVTRTYMISYAHATDNGGCTISQDSGVTYAAMGGAPSLSQIVYVHVRGMGGGLVRVVTETFSNTESFYSFTPPDGFIYFGTANHTANDVSFSIKKL